MALANMTPGQHATGTLTFSGGTPADGAVTSDNPAIATISLAADLASWTVIAVGPGSYNMSYTGTSVAPLVGPCAVPPMSGTVEAAAVAETGSFNEGSAVITGP